MMDHIGSSRVLHGLVHVWSQTSALQCRSSKNDEALMQLLQLRTMYDVAATLR